MGNVDAPFTLLEALAAARVINGNTLAVNKVLIM
jgi:hypothetical protein